MSVQPLFTQSTYFRFHNRSEDIENLYFVGAGTHPSAGMPGLLCSAKVLERVLPEARAGNADAARDVILSAAQDLSSISGER